MTARPIVSTDDLALRDHFAGLAMQAIVSNVIGNHDLFAEYMDMAREDEISTALLIANFAYEHADAMLIARKK